MLIEKQEIRKVFASNCNQQIALLRNIQLKLSETNDLSLEIQISVKELAEIQTMMHRWMELTAENELLIVKYQKQCRVGQIDIGEYQSLECALATQLYIRDSVEKQGSLRGIYKSQRFIVWNGLQKYNFGPLLANL